MNKAILIIDMPEYCYECPLENSKRCPFLWEDVESLDKSKDCPLKPYEESIPVKWIKNYLKTSPKMWQGYHDEDLVQEMIEDWEIEK